MRRALLPILGAALAGGACAPSPAGEAPPQPPRPPNIIYILADDLGYGDLGVYGQTTIRTPRLDRMAGEGLRFTQHYSGSPVCAPSRSALLTGQHTGHTTVRGNFAAAGQNRGERVPLRSEDVTVAEVLKSAGYATGVIGKWGLGEPGTPGVPGRQGFDSFFGYLNQRHAHSHYPEYLWRDDRKVPLEGNRDGGRRQYTHDLFTREALDFVERNRARPFFLYLAYTVPHAEVAAPADSLLASYSGALAPTEAAFAAMVTRLDRDVGRLLDRLRELGLEQNTIVLFTSDNGPHAEGGHDPEVFDSNGPLRGIKRDLYEGGIRVPMIAWGPGRIRGGGVTDHPSAFWDFLPTAAELAGAEVPAGVDGLSFAPTLLGRAQPRHEYLYWEFYEGVPAQAVRMGRWKALRRPAFRGEIELYDLESDPREEADVAAAHPEIVERARAAMDASHAPSPHWGVAALDPVTAR